MEKDNIEKKKNIYLKKIDILIKKCEEYDLLYKNFYFFITKIKSNNNIVIVRNLKYINYMLKNIKLHLKLALKKNVKDDDYIEYIRKKIAIGTVLIDNITYLNSNFAIEQYDYETQNLLNNQDVINQLSNNIEGFSNVSFTKQNANNLVNILKSNLKSTRNINKKYENFTSTDKLIEGFSKATEFFTKLLTYWIPKLFINLISFIKNFFLKLVKTWFLVFIPILYFTTGKLVKEYWIYLLGKDIVDNENHSFLIEYPTLFGGAYFWWMNTDTVAKLQNVILASIVPILYNLKFFLVLLAGIPQDDPFFTYKGNNMAKKQELFLNMIFKSFFTFIVRSIFFSYVISGIINRRYLELSAILIPSEKEILILPLLMLRRYLTYLFTILYTTIGSILF